jgi:hypothetical protein
MESQININIKAKSIYMHSLSVIEFVSANKFTVKLSNEIISLELGNLTSNGYIESIKKENNHIIHLDLIGLFSEREIITDKENPLNKQLGNHYGMRFYPFISSSIISNITIKNGTVGQIIIELPDQFRWIFFKSNIYQNGKLAQRRHSYDADISKYVFDWTNQDYQISKENKLSFDIPIRLGSATLDKLIKFPIYYWIISLFGVFVTAFTEDYRFVIAAVAATWLFMVERWSKSNLPQQNTLLTFFYLIAGFITAIWGACMSLKESNLCITFTISIILILLIIVCFVVSLFRLINFFKLKGKLPYKLAYFYSKWIIKGDNKREKQPKNAK